MKQNNKKLSYLLESCADKVSIGFISVLLSGDFVRLRFGLLEGLWDVFAAGISDRFEVSSFLYLYSCKPTK